MQFTKLQIFFATANPMLSLIVGRLGQSEQINAVAIKMDGAIYLLMWLCRPSTPSTHKHSQCRALPAGRGPKAVLAVRRVSQGLNKSNVIHFPFLNDGNERPSVRSP